MAYGSCYSPDFRVASLNGATLFNTAQANDRRLVESFPSSAGVTFVADSIDVGRYAARCDSTSAGASIGLALIAASSRYAGGLCRFQRVSGSIATQGLVGMLASTTTDNIRVRIGSTGLLGYSFDNATTYTDTAVNVNTGVHALEVYVDWNVSTTHTLKIRLDGVEVVNTTGGASTVTASTSSGPVQFGGFTTGASVIDFADLVTYNDSAQYGLMSDWRVYGLEPTSDGTHSMTANDFQDDAATNLSNATTTSWSKVSDAPAAAPTVTSFVQQVVTRSTSYMEWVLRTNGIPSGAGTPVLVCLVAAMHPVGSALANSVAFRLNSGGNLSTEAAIDTSIASNTLEYRKHHYLTEPATAATWTVAMANALRARFGYSGDASPPPALDSIMAFVVCPQTAVSATAASSSSSSITAAGTATHHQYSGTAASASASSITAAGTASHHQYAGTAASASTSSITAAGTATPHQYAGTADSSSASSITAAGAASHHQYSGSGDSASVSSIIAVGTATHHQYVGTAASASTSSITAMGEQTGEGVANVTGTSAITSAGLASPHQYLGVADITSLSLVQAVGLVHVVPAGGTPSRIMPWVRFPHQADRAWITGRSRITADGTVVRGRAQVEEDDVERLLELLGFTDWQAR